MEIFRIDFRPRHRSEPELGPTEHRRWSKNWHADVVSPRCIDAAKVMLIYIITAGPTKHALVTSVWSHNRFHPPGRGRSPDTRPSSDSASSRNACLQRKDPFYAIRQDGSLSKP